MRFLIVQFNKYSKPSHILDIDTIFVGRLKLVFKVKGHTQKTSAPPSPNQITSAFKTLSSTIEPQLPNTENLSLYVMCQGLGTNWPTTRRISTLIMVSIKEPMIQMSAHPITDLSIASEGWVWSFHSKEKRFE
ncbi:hypothetical protein PPACK8108_LOCUS3155 [Phakopsora pachyrhizi]|uniref:Uncharacterized protein n=1 Tax=Phakopsora pachyrhizi TaxID=170000 RepID=A0AAV0AJH4_PHAPC|nr:hypothetical protein PPACK8108_LOCUS3155 [Phakopsora pachyrhizi]